LDHELDLLADYFSSAPDRLLTPPPSPTPDEPEAYQRYSPVPAVEEISDTEPYEHCSFVPLLLPQEPPYDEFGDFDTLIETRTPEHFDISDEAMPDLLGASAQQPSSNSPVRTAPKMEPAGSPSKRQHVGPAAAQPPNWSPHGLGRAFVQDPIHQVNASAPAAAASSSSPTDLKKMMSFLGTMRDEQKTGFSNMEQSHNSQITALKTHLEDSLTLCRDEYREHARHAAQRCTDLEAEFKKLQTSVSAEQTELKKQVTAKVQASAFADFGRQAQSSSSKFVARKMFARGWCTFGCEATEGVKSAELIAAGSALIDMLTSEMQSWVMEPAKRFHAPHFRNRQLQINLNEVGPEDAGWQICRVINDRLKNEGSTLNGKSFYLTPDMELWKRQRNGCINRANEVILRDLPPLSNSELIKDWAV